MQHVDHGQARETVPTLLLLQGHPVTNSNASTLVQALTRVRVLTLREVQVKGAEFLGALARCCTALDRLILNNVSKTAIANTNRA